MMKKSAFLIVMLGISVLRAEVASASAEASTDYKVIDGACYFNIAGLENGLSKQELEDVIDKGAATIKSNSAFLNGVANSSVLQNNNELKELIKEGFDKLRLFKHELDIIKSCSDKL